MIKLTQEDILHLHKNDNIKTFILNGKACPYEVINTLCERLNKVEKKMSVLESKLEIALEGIYEY